MKILTFLTAALTTLAMTFQLVEGQEEQKVYNSIRQWYLDVSGVNFFLDEAPSLSNELLRDAAQNALDFANDEPHQLRILSEVPGLSQDGQNAAIDLENVFPNIPEQLRNITEHPTDPGFVAACLNIINTDRCTRVLPDLQVLWPAAATAAGAPVPPPVPFPTTC